MTGQLLVGIAGPMRAGKDTVGMVLRERHGFAHASFAAKVYAFLYALNPIVLARDGGGLGTVGQYRVQALVDAYGWERSKDLFPEVRALLQRCGTDAGRVVLGQNVWVDAAMAGIRPDQPVVFTDCRFPNEADAIKAAGGWVIRVERPGFDPGPGAHVSETALEGYEFDGTIHNDGTLEDLRGKVAALVAVMELSRNARPES